jgi:hypothetical protein
MLKFIWAAAHQRTFGVLNMSQKTKLYNIIWFVPLSLLFLPSIALAHGNPLFVAGLGGIAFIHLGFGMFFVFRKIDWIKKSGIVALYFIVILLSWNWALNYKGPDFSIMFTVLLVIPLMSFLGLAYVVKKISRCR